MLRVRNLIVFAQRHDVAGFTKSVGPIGLMQTLTFASLQASEFHTRLSAR